MRIGFSQMIIDPPTRQNKMTKMELEEGRVLKRRYRAIRRFRALIRRVIENLYWLSVDEQEYEGDDVKLRVLHAMRTRKNKRQKLSVRDKTLLHKPIQERTEEEKKYIFKMIGDFKCFRRYPVEVRKQLSAASYFQYYGPGRVVVRENRPAYALYFIMSGSVLITENVYDPVLEEYVAVERNTLKVGDNFGEMALLYDIPRTATATTIDHCELLQLLDKDFKTILQATVQKQWDEINDAISRFSYFDALDVVSLRSACIVAKMRRFNPDEVILGDGKGIANHVYFILRGTVQMIESLRVLVNVDYIGRTHFTLLDEEEPDEEVVLSLEERLRAAYPNLHKNIDRSSDVMLPSRERMSTLTAAAAAKVSRSSLGRQSINQSMRTSRLGSVKIQESAILAPKRSFATDEKTEQDTTTVLGSQASQLTPSEQSIRAKRPTEASIASTRRLSKLSSEVLLPALDDPYSRHSRKFSTILKKEKIDESPQDSDQENGDHRTYFMEVCRMNEGSTFGLGENMRDRRIVALTPVKCMLIPRVWLMERNTANIWTRIKYYLNKKIPRKRQLFEEFLNQQRWQKYREEVVKDVLKNVVPTNHTSLHDVPYSLRLDKMYDIAY